DSSKVDVLYRLRHQSGKVHRLKDRDRFDSIKHDTRPVSWGKTLRIPKSLPAGKYQLIAQLLLGYDEVDANLVNNNVSSGFDIDVFSAFSDLEITFAEPQKKQKIQVPKELGVDLLVRNKGNDDSAAFKVSYLLKNQRGDIVPLAAERRIKMVPAGSQTNPWKEKLRIPEDLQGGYYRLIARMDLEDATFEKNAVNNQIETVQDFLYLPPFSDIAIRAVKDVAPAAVMSGRPVQCRFEVGYKGNVESPEFVVSYQLKDESGEIFTFPDHDRFSSFKPRQEPRSWDKELLIPIKFADGDYELAASVQVAEGATDSNPENDRIAVAPTLQITTSFTDIEISVSSEIPWQSIEPMDRIALQFSMNNQGNVDNPGVRVHYYLQHESGEKHEVAESDRFQDIEAEGGTVSWEKQFRLPPRLDDGKYRILAEVLPEREELERDFDNNRVDSGFNLVYVAPTPAPWLHASAISLTLGSAYLFLSENDKYDGTIEERSDLNNELAAADTVSEIAVINGELQNNKNRMKLHIQKADMWGVLALVGIGWEVYNIFFWRPDVPDDPELASGDEGIDPDTWLHVSAIGLTLVSYGMSRTEQDSYEELSKENDQLQAQYPSTSSPSEILVIRNKIESNRNQMATHIDNANIFDGLALIALGWESYLLWQSFMNPDPDLAGYRDPFAPTLRLQPRFARASFGIALQWTW
ncbi:MAG: hypothetical protein GY866_40105, partial [Proteobacteria bacterium]|nr:hypothetical protein [Pseudomonadota bacterium]